jgi:WD40 repeat protein
LNGHEADVKCAQFAASHGQWGDGDEILLSGGYDDTIKVWAEDAGDWYCALSIKDVHSDTIWSLAVSPGGSRLVSASADGSISILKNYTAAEKRSCFQKKEVGILKLVMVGAPTADKSGLARALGKEKKWQTTTHQTFGHPSQNQKTSALASGGTFSDRLFCPAMIDCHTSRSLWKHPNGCRVDDLPQFLLF